MMNFITEAFRSLADLNEDLFDTSPESIKALDSTLNTDIESEPIRVIDDDAETYDDINDAYVGKVIIDCNVCHSHIFKNKEDLVISEEGEVNVEEQCPYCGEQGGFIIVGEISKYPKNDEETEIAEPAEEELAKDESKVEESFSSNSRKFISRKHVVEKLSSEKCDDECAEGNPDKGESEEALSTTLTEEVNNVNVETDDSIVNVSTEEGGKVVVTTEPKTSDSGDATEEFITPVSPETEEEIISQNETNSEEPAEMTEVEFDIDEIDEESIDELGESYLKRVYENVNSFKTSTVSSKDNRIIIEGVIKFKSGTEKKTGFIFEAKNATKTGKVKFIGENKHLCRGSKAFTLTGKLEGNKLIGESFTYNYRAKNHEGKPTKVYGTVHSTRK